MDDSQRTQSDSTSTPEWLSFQVWNDWQVACPCRKEPQNAIHVEGRKYSIGEIVQCTQCGAQYRIVEPLAGDLGGGQIEKVIVSELMRQMGLSGKRYAFARDTKQGWLVESLNP